MEFRAEYSSQIATGAKADAQAVRQLRTELEAANKALGETAAAKGPSAGPLAAGGAGAGGKANPAKAFDSDEFKLGVLRAKTRREQEEKALQQLGIGLSQAEKDAEAKRAQGAKDAAAKREKAEKEAETKAKDSAKAKKATRDRLLGVGVGLAAGAAGLALAGGRAALGAVGQAAGVNGLADLTRLAMGIRGMAQLQALSMRTQLQVRKIFSGVDSSPAVRAADRFLNSIFNGSTAAGKALKGIVDRNANDIMKTLERGQPAATAFFQALIIGALQAESSYLDLRLALLPVTDLLEEAAGPAGDLAEQLGLGGSAAEIFGNSIRAVLQPMVDGARLAGLLADQITRLRAQMSGEDHGVTELNFGGREAAGPTGQATGKAYADGLAKGAASGAGAVDAAGRNLGIGLDKGVRAATETHSPSKVAERTGKEYPAGYAIGVEKGSPKVDAAVEKMSPGGGSGGSAGALSSSPSMTLNQTFNITVGGTGNAANDIRVEVRRVLVEETRAAFVSLGFSPALSAGGGVP